MLGQVYIGAYSFYFKSVIRPVGLIVFRGPLTHFCFVQARHIPYLYLILTFHFRHPHAIPRHYFAF